MSSCAERPPRPPQRAAAPALIAIAVLAATTAAPAAAPRGTAGSDDAAAKPTPAQFQATYRLRCWQWGKLIIDETGVPMPRDPGSALELFRLARASGQAPLAVVVRAGTTCLVKPERSREGELTPYTW